MENTNDIDDTITLPENNETTRKSKTVDDLEEVSIKDQEERRETRCYDYIASSRIFNIGYWWWPTLDDVLWKATVLVIMLLMWGATYASTGRLALPGGGIFNLGTLIITAHAAAVLGSYIAIPQIVSMLLVGVIFRNLKVVDIHGTVDKEVLGQIRCSALTLILICAGLGLDPVALRRLGLGVICLSFIPCLMEMMALSVIAHFTLKMPFLWSLLLGSTLCAVSPAVVVNYLLALKENGYGVNKGIPTLIVAAASTDDIVAISAFGIAASILFSKGSIIMRALLGPIEIVIGLVSGTILGAIATILPHETNRHVVFYRSIILASGSFFLVLLSRKFEMVGAGYITSIVSSFTATLGWRICNWKEWEKPLQHGFNVAWNVMQHFLFALIGYELDLNKFDWSDTFLQIATFGAGLLVRLMTAFAVTLVDDFNWKERLFVTIAWIPKATVQAATGPVALDLVEKYHGSDEEKYYAEIIMKMAILTILITAPLGSMGILFSGPKLLSKESDDTEKKYIDLQAISHQKEKSICERLCPRNRRKFLDKYFKLHRRSVQVSFDETALSQMM